jgi:hypothetical protein
MTATLNIDLPRNGHFLRELTVYAQDGSVVDLTGATLEASARDIPGGTIIASAAVSLVEATAGKLELLWTGSDFDSFGSLTQVARPSYDLKITLNGITDVIRGQINLLPESTP